MKKKISFETKVDAQHAIYRVMLLLAYTRQCHIFFFRGDRQKYEWIFFCLKWHKLFLRRISGSLFYLSVCGNFPLKKKISGRNDFGYIIVPQSAPRCVRILSAECKNRKQNNQRKHRRQIPFSIALTGKFNTFCWQSSLIPPTDLFNIFVITSSGQEERERQKTKCKCEIWIANVTPLPAGYNSTNLFTCHILLPFRLCSENLFSIKPYDISRKNIHCSPLIGLSGR